jgi:hypothetical protein
MNILLWLSYGIFISVVLSNHEGGYASPQTQPDIQSDRRSTRFFSQPAHPQRPLKFQLQPTQNLTGWSIENSFSKKVISSDPKEDSGSSDRPSNLKFNDSPFDDLYSLKVEFSQKIETGALEQNNIFSLKLLKNPLALSGVGVPALDNIYGLSTTSTLPIPSPFVATDFISQKNALYFTIQHEASFADRFSFSFFGEIYPKIADLSVVPNWPTLDPQNVDTFNLEMEASYQINDATSAYSFVNREGNDVLDLELGLSYQINDIISIYGSIVRSLFPSSSNEINDTGKIGLSFSLFEGNLDTSLSLYKTIANNVGITNEDSSDVIVSVGQYTRQGIELSAFGSPMSGLNIEAIYTYADTTQPDAAQHTIELALSYEISEGKLKGLGVASSIFWESGFTPKQEDIVNPNNIEASAGVFYVGNGYRAALRLENLFMPKDLALIGSIIFKF